MKTSGNILYEALKDRDARFDGKLYFGVVTTGIYCRPICPAPKPKPENVLYFADSESAQCAGFRPCKRCRPDARPGSPAWQGTGATIQRALRLLASVDGPESLHELADKLGLTDRYLRRLFVQHTGKSPVQIRQETRLKLALALLEDDKARRMTDIAYAAGFKSLRRFNDVFKKAYGTTPSKWRQDHVAR